MAIFFHVVIFYDKFTLLALIIKKDKKQQQLKNSSSKDENDHIFHLSFTKYLSMDAYHI